MTKNKQYNNLSYNIGLHTTVSEWQHMNNIITTHISLGYM